MIMFIMMVVEGRPGQTYLSKEYVLKYEFHILFGDSSRNGLLELSP